MAEDYAAGSFNLAYDSLTGTLQKMHITTDQKLVFETTVELGNLPEINAAQMNETSRTQKSGDMVKVASLPMMVYLDLRQKGILDDKAAMRKWLKSEEARPYRTHWMAG
jgi:hypothetical protein